MEQAISTGEPPPPPPRSAPKGSDSPRTAAKRRASSRRRASAGPRAGVENRRAMSLSSRARSVSPEAMARESATSARSTLSAALSDSQRGRRPQSSTSARARSFGSRSCTSSSGAKGHSCSHRSMKSQSPGLLARAHGSTASRKVSGSLRATKRCTSWHGCSASIRSFSARPRLDHLWRKSSSRSAAASRGDPSTGRSELSAPHTLAAQSTTLSLVLLSADSLTDPPGSRTLTRRGSRHASPWESGSSSAVGLTGAAVAGTEPPTATQPLAAPRPSAKTTADAKACPEVPSATPREARCSGPTRTSPLRSGRSPQTNTGGAQNSKVAVEGGWVSRLPVQAKRSSPIIRRSPDILCLPLALQERRHLGDSDIRAKLCWCQSRRALVSAGRTSRLGGSRRVPGVALPAATAWRRSWT
mmetsp:Transcript_35866/g.85029  ORF Transcript_35866/g.85029 Transcript_35866/m.85029 type:complete len:415 (-) Transcript_35866:221-1465(-)